MRARADAVEATKERLLASAWRHFSDRPYEQVRLTDIAADAGVTVPTLHARVGTKDELFVSAWAWAIVPEGAQRKSVPIGDVRRAVRELYDSYERQGDAVFRMLAAEDRIPAVHDMAEQGRAWHGSWVERTLAPLLEGMTGARRERRLVTLVVAT